MVQLTVEHADGSTETIPQTTRWTRKRELGKMRRAQIDVERSLAQNVTLTEKSDLIHLGSIDTLRLVDVKTGGSTWTLKCYSLEWDANHVAPTAGGNLRQGTDDTLVNGLISEVPTWSAGTVNSFTGPLNFVYNHAHRHEALRRIERNTTGEVQFRDEGTVDYVQSLGTDRSGSVELSGSAGTIEDDITITNRGRKLDGTHIRVLGAHEGEAQKFANLVPSTDPETYENRVDYTTSRWSIGDTDDWDRWENKDLTDQATLEEEAAALGEEITESHVEAKATVAGVSPVLNVGDWVQVVKPDANLDRRMRVHRVTTIVEGTTRTDKVLLSTRTIARDDNVRDLRSLRQFNTGFQGTSVVLGGGGARQPVSASVNAFESFRYPEVEFEDVAEVEVRGLPYRAFSSGAVDNAEFASVEEAGQPELNYGWAGGQFNGGAEKTLWSFTPSNSGSVTFVSTIVTPTSLTYSPDFDLWVENTTTGDVFPPSKISYFVLDAGRGMTINVADPTDTNGETLAVKMQQTDASTGDGNLAVAGSYQVWGNHTHDPNPGVIEFGAETPSNCDLLINGSTVASNIGSGTFETVVDIAGELTQGAWNDLEVTSDTLGHVAIRPYVESYKQIGKK